MSDPFERKLAAEMMAHRLEKEYATNPVVHHCLQAVRNGDVSLADGLTGCIALLCEQNKTLQDEVLRLSELQPAVFHIGEGLAYTAKQKTRKP
jgi:hypothetical protein